MSILKEPMRMGDAARIAVAVVKGRHTSVPVAKETAKTPTASRTVRSLSAAFARLSAGNQEKK